MAQKVIHILIRKCFLNVLAFFVKQSLQFLLRTEVTKGDKKRTQVKWYTQPLRAQCVFGGFRVRYSNLSQTIHIEVQQIKLWHSQQTGIFESSVTRCCNKKKPNDFLRLTKKQPRKFYLKRDVLQKQPQFAKHLDNF